MAGLCRFLGSCFNCFQTHEELNQTTVKRSTASASHKKKASNAKAGKRRTSGVQAEDIVLTHQNTIQDNDIEKGLATPNQNQ